MEIAHLDADFLRTNRSPNCKRNLCKIFPAIIPVCNSCLTFAICASQCVRSLGPELCKLTRQALGGMTLVRTCPTDGWVGRGRASMPASVLVKFIPACPIDLRQLSSFALNAALGAATVGIERRRAGSRPGCPPQGSFLGSSTEQCLSFAWLRYAL